MRVATLECFAGISGDMFLGALIDAGVPVGVLEEATAALGLGATLRVRRVDRSGITATKVDVMEGAELAEDAGIASAGGRDEQGTREYAVQPKTQHLHKAGHVHTHVHEGDEHAEHTHTHGEKEQAHTHGDGHTHGHAHGRSLTVIRRLIGEAALPDEVKEFALRAFGLLGESEAKIHNVPVDEIHFHEVGAVDAIVDIVGAAAGVRYLREQARAETGEAMQWFCSALNVGSGTVECAHGTFPVPAPATADLLRGLPTYAAHLAKEMVTPTGAALVRALGPSFAAAPVLLVRSIGYGAGSRDPKGFANVLRLSLGETAGEGLGVGGDGAAETVAAGTGPAAAAAETVVVLETAIDDLDPQVVAYVLDLLLERGALDAMSQPVGMKKGRQGTLLTVLATEAGADALEEVLLRETSTLGVRRRVETRVRLERRHVPVETEFGQVRVKAGSLRGEEINARPEYEDCRRLARERGVALKRVIDAAMLAYAGR